MEELPSLGIKSYFHSNGFQNRKRYSSLDYCKKRYLQKNNYFRKKKEINNNTNCMSDFILIVKNRKNEINSNKNNILINSYSKSNLNNHLNQKGKINNNNNDIIPLTYYKFYPKLKVTNSTDKINSKSYNDLQNIQENNNIYLYKDTNLSLPFFQKDKNKDNENNNSKQSIQKKENNSYSILIKDNNNSPSQNNINNIQKDSIYVLKHNLNNNYLCYTQKKKASGKNFATIGYLPKRNNYNFFKSKTNVKKKEKDIEYKAIKPFKAINLLNKNNNNNNSMLNKRKCPLCYREVDYYRYRFHLNLHPSKVLEWLYLGSYRDARNIKGLKDLKINYVLNCAIECLDSYPSNIKYCHLKINDMPSFQIIPFFEKATSFINNAHLNNGNILVHCQLGISRSTTCVIAYFIKYLGYTAMDALTFIKRKRPQVMPNFGFLQQLNKYENNNMSLTRK